MKFDLKLVRAALRSPATDKLYAPWEGWTFTNAWAVRAELPPTTRVRRDVEDLRRQSPPQINHLLTQVRAHLPTAVPAHRVLDRAEDIRPSGQMVPFAVEDGASELREVWVAEPFAHLLEACARVVANAALGAAVNLEPLIGLDEAGEIVVIVMPIRR